MRTSLFRLYRPDIQATLKISLPIVIAQLGTVLMGVADNIMVGRLGPAPIAAAGIANSVFFLLAVLGIGSVSVIAPQVATAFGKQATEECRQLLRTAIRLGLGIGILLALGIAVLALNFHIFKQTPAVMELAVSYLLIIAISVIPLIYFMALKQFSDGLSYTQVAMTITVIGLAVNVFCNWVLIYGNLGFPAWGLDGAGWATVIARTVMALGLMLYIYRAPAFRIFTATPSIRVSLMPLLKKILRLGLPGGFQLFFEVGAFSGAAIVAGWLGTVPLAAHQIAINLASVTYMIAAGISAAGAIRVGQAVGQYSPEKIVRAGTVALVLSVVFMAAACLIFLTMNYALVRLYISDPEVVALAASLVIIGGFFQLSDGVQVVGLGILRGIADVNIPTIITLFAYWGIGLPLGYVLAFTLNMGAQGIWFGLLGGLSTSALLLTIRFYQRTRKMSRQNMFIRPSVAVEPGAAFK